MANTNESRPTSEADKVHNDGAHHVPNRYGNGPWDKGWGSPNKGK